MKKIPQGGAAAVSWMRIVVCTCTAAVCAMIAEGCSRPVVTQPQHVTASPQGQQPQQPVATNAITTATGTNRNGVLMEIWYHLGGADVQDLVKNPSFPNSPTERIVIPTLELPKQFGDMYGVRLRGFLQPPRSGKFTFWVAADDTGEFWLSRNEQPAGKIRLCRNQQWTAAHAWDKYPEQRSETISLIGGQRYYLEALMKQSGGGEHLSVAWEGPGFARQIIEGEYLSVPAN